MTVLQVEGRHLSDWDGVELSIPGDKSITHRAFLLASLCPVPIHIRYALESEDCLNTLKLVRDLGVEVDRIADGEYQVSGVGLKGWSAPQSDRLDVGNSGTLIRLIAGLLAGQSFATTLTGDAAIQNRPMNRIIIPLRDMGADISGVSKPGKSDLYPPLKISPVSELKGISYAMPMASAQVKSAILLAGLYARNGVTVTEPGRCRDHTERLLSFLGCPIARKGGEIRLDEIKTDFTPPQTQWEVPADLSSAAFFIVLGLLAKSGSLGLKRIGLNPTRVAFLEILKQMGAKIDYSNADETGPEPLADLTVYPSTLTNVDIPVDLVGDLIDEIPILAVAGMYASGAFEIRGAEELRYKESDRIQTTLRLVRALGADAQEFSDGFRIDPLQSRPQDFELDPAYDHRIVMSGTVAAIIGGCSAKIKDSQCIRTSFPEFLSLIQRLGVRINES